MLVRAYRLTDKLGILTLKSSLALVEATLDGLSVLWRQIARVLLAVAGILWFILRPLLRLLMLVGLGVLNLFRRMMGQTVVSANRGMSNTMARRAARAEMRTLVAEDPLRSTNRTLSVLTVLLLAALVVVVLWATSPARNEALAVVAPLDNPQPFNVAQTQPTAASNAPVLLSSPVPTVTPLPDVLQVRGSLAYVVRESGQTDIWAIPIGSRAPIRLTNSPTDERDPAWSPDGRRLAFASRQDGNWEIYIYDLAADSTTRMTYDLSFQGAPSWSPDGNWIAYESYQGNNLDVYLMRLDGTEPPIRLPGNDDAPDFSPAWSPDGRRIAFVSWRDGNQDIYVFSLDDLSVTNVTNTPDRHEDYPAWSPPNGELLTYSALDEGLEKVFVKPADAPDTPAQVLERGRAPAWSPDGASLVFAVDSVDGTQLIVSPFTESGVITSILGAPFGSSDPTWSSAPLPGALVNAGGLPPAISEPLFIEQEVQRPVDPPFALNPLSNVLVENGALSDRVNDSFNAMRQAVQAQAGWDFLGRLDHAFWPLERLPEPGVERRHWLLTGRAFAVTRNSIAGFPPPLEIVREDIGVDTYWRLYIYVSDNEQTGRLGEPLRRMPWDIASRTQGDVEAYDQGGRLRTVMPSGYYIDLTQIAQDYGWLRAPAGSDWRANANTINYWLFRKTDGLAWLDAMREIYPEGQLINFLPTPAPAPGQPTSALQVTIQAVPQTSVAPPTAETTAAPNTSSELPPDAAALLTPGAESAGQP